MYLDVVRNTAYCMVGGGLCILELHASLRVVYLDVVWNTANCMPSGGLCIWM